MRAINYTFISLGELHAALLRHEDDQELALPENPCGEVVDCGVHAGEWVLASVAVGDDQVALAAQVVDRDQGMVLAFEDRDWDKLCRFAERSRVAAPPTLPPPPPAETVSPMGAHVLLVDQEEDTREVVSGLLLAGGYQVTCVPSAEHAFDSLRDISVELVLLEATLPGMSGIDFCRRVRRDARHASMPIVFLSTQSSSDSVVQAFEAGADDYITKPFRAPELAARVIGLLRRSRMPPHGR